MRELPTARPVELIGAFLQLQLVRNPGAAFSTGSLTPLITVFALAAAVVVGRSSRAVRHRGWAVGLGLLLAGVTGNLLDRLLREPGPVPRPRGRLLRAAELAGLQRRRHLHQRGAVFFVILLLRGIRLDGSRHEEQPQDES